MPSDTDAVSAAEQAGFDLSLVRESMLQTHEERAERHEAALALALELQMIGERHRAQPEPSAAAPQPS